MGYLEVKGFLNSSTYSWEKQGVTISRNFWTHCSTRGSAECVVSFFWRIGKVTPPEKRKSCAFHLKIVEMGASNAFLPLFFLVKMHARRDEARSPTGRTESLTPAAPRRLLQLRQEKVQELHITQSIFVNVIFTQWVPPFSHVGATSSPIKGVGTHHTS